MKDEIPLSEKLRVARMRKGMTRQQLAGLTGLSPSYISQIESGKAQPSLDTLAFMARALDITPRDLTGGAPKKPTAAPSSSRGRAFLKWCAGFFTERQVFVALLGVIATLLLVAVTYELVQATKGHGTSGSRTPGGSHLRTTPNAREPARAPDAVSGPSRVSAASLKLQAPVFAPARIKVSRVSKNGSKELKHGEFPGALHSTTYDRWSRITGYYQEAEVPGGESLEFFEYEGSRFDTVQDAAAAWKDGSRYLLSVRYPVWKPTRCPSVGTSHCTRLIYKLTDKGRKSWVDEIQVKDCLIETSGAASKSYLIGRPKEVYTVLLNVDRTAVIQAKQVCR